MIPMITMMTAGNDPFIQGDPSSLKWPATITDIAATMIAILRPASHSMVQEEFEDLGG